MGPVERHKRRAPKLVRRRDSRSSLIDVFNEAEIEQLGVRLTAPLPRMM